MTLITSFYLSLTEYSEWAVREENRRFLTMSQSRQKCEIKFENLLLILPTAYQADMTKEVPTWEEMCIKVARALEDDYCPSFT